MNNQERLDKSSAILQATTPSTTTSVQQTIKLQSPARTLTAPSHARSSSSASTTSRSESRIFSGSESLNSTDASSISSTGDTTRITTFFELCVNTGEHLKTLGEIDLTNARCDGDLFGAIQERYLSLRGHRAKFWLLKPAAVSYVRVRIIEVISVVKHHY